MDLKTWAPFPYFDKDWRFEFPLHRETGEFRPSVDVVRSDEKLIVTAELAGMTADDVSVSLEDDVLIIRGEKADEREVEEDDRYIHERTFGAFQRRITVPEGVTADSIEADIDNGVLTLEVELPEHTETEPQRIPIKTA